MDWILYSKNNQEMVDKFTRLGIIESSEVERAFRCVSRAAFVPEALLDDAFKDTPLRGGCHVHMSAPHMYAAILEELELDAGMSFLNVGSGTGYFSTLAGYIIKKDGINHGIELHEDLVRFANEKFQCFLEHGPADTKEICAPIFISGNCCRLDTEQIKYDRLYCGASCFQANVKFLLELVKVGGFLIAPVGSRLIKVKRVSLKEGRQSVINDVSFAPLVAPTAEDKKLPKLRFPDHCRKRNKQNAVFCDVSFPVCKSPARKTLAQLRAFQDAINCLQTSRPLPMPFCYVPCKEDVNWAKGKQNSSKCGKDMKHLDEESKRRIAVDSQIDFFTSASFNEAPDCNDPVRIEKLKREFQKATGCRKKNIDIDWNHISMDKTWFEVLEHYYSLCATTDAKRKECFKLKAEDSSLQFDKLKILTFKKYVKKMGIIPSKYSSTKSFATDDMPKVEEVANDIVCNLLEEVINQVDENQSAEDFVAAITASSDFRRRSSVSRAMILDNLPRLRACSEESRVTSSRLELLLRDADNESSRDVKDMQSAVYRMIAEVDQQILNDITTDDIIANASTADDITADVTSTDAISEDAITADDLTTDNIPGNDMIANAVTTDDIIANAISTDAISEDAITADDLTTDNIPGNDMIANAVTTDDIIANAISTDAISEDAITADGLTADKISGNDIFKYIDEYSINSVQDYLLRDRSNLDKSKNKPIDQKSIPSNAGPEEARPNCNSDFDFRCGDVANDNDKESEKEAHLISATSASNNPCFLQIAAPEMTYIKNGDSPGFFLPSAELNDVSDRHVFVDTDLKQRYSSFYGDERERHGESLKCIDVPSRERQAVANNADSLSHRLTNYLSSTAEDLNNVVEDSPQNRSTECTPNRSALQNNSFCFNLFNSKQRSSEECTKNELKYEIPTSSHYMDSDHGNYDVDDSFAKCFRTLSKSLADDSNEAWTNEFRGMKQSMDQSEKCESFQRSDSMVASTPAQMSMDIVEAAEQGREQPQTENDKQLKESLILKTSYSSSFKKKKKLRRRFTNIKMDVDSSEMLRALPGESWNIKHDRELVLFLTRKETATAHVAFSPCCASVIKPQCFTSTDLIQYKNICSFPATTLASRAIVLKRLAKVLDSLMNLLVGPSLPRNQFKTPSKIEFPLPSFSETSFESSGISLKSSFNNQSTNSQSTNNQSMNNQSMNNQSVNNQSMSTGSTNFNAIRNAGDENEQGLVDVVDRLIQQEIENVCEQKEIVFAKLNLYDKLNKEYEEQRKLIGQQVDLIEEQQQLLQNRLRGNDDSFSACMSQTQQMLLERKLHRTQLVERQEQVESQQLGKNAEHKALLQIHNQLTGLQNKLVEEQNEFLKMGRRYLEKDGGELASFSKFVAMSNELVNHLSALNLESDLEEQKSVFEKSKKCNRRQNGSDEQTNKEFMESRYNPHLLLSKCRFLFPLTTKRLCIIKDLLRASETNASHPCFPVRVDRKVPLRERHKYPASNTVFMQLYNGLKNKELNYRDSKRSFEKLWEVKFIGEGIIDQGGGFRDSFAEIADELCPASADVKQCLSLFVKSPNQRNEVGDHRDAYIPNPSCKDFHLYTWIGKLMGTAFRSDETIPVSFPPFIWKLLLGEHVAWATDFIGVDETVVRVTDGVELIDAATYERRYGSVQFYMTYLSDGSEKPLIKNGGDILVEAADRQKFAAMVRRARILESSKQVHAMREGLLAVVPESILSCLTWQDLERGICGLPEITLSDLKANCRYDFDLSANKECVDNLWECLAGFTSEERSKFIRFVTGRKRLPSPFYLSRSSTDGDDLPTASTCGSNLFLPNYSSAAVAAEKIRYAINNCVSIDCDTSPW